jgi:uncharacterized protein (DUF302 family)
MKNTTGMFIIGVFVGLVIAVIVVFTVVPKVLFLVDESTLPFEETVEQIENSVYENKWSMPNQYDLQATMKKHGFDVNPVKVFSVCKPSLANEILGSNNERFVSALMPCRVAVYQKDNGKTYISRMNAPLVASLLGKKIKTVMKEAGRENELILESVVKK